MAGEHLGKWLISCRWAPKSTAVGLNQVPDPRAAVGDSGKCCLTEQLQAQFQLDCHGQKGFSLKKNQFILYFLCWFNRNWGLHFGQEVYSSGGCALLFSFEVTLGDAQGSCPELEIQHGPLACTWVLESSLALLQLLVARLKSKELWSWPTVGYGAPNKTTCGTWDHF